MPCRGQSSQGFAPTSGHWSSPAAKVCRLGRGFEAPYGSLHPSFPLTSGLTYAGTLIASPIQ